MKNKKTKSAGIARDLRHRIRVIECLGIGNLYEILVWNPGLGLKKYPRFKLLIQVENYNDIEIMYKHLASLATSCGGAVDTFFEDTTIFGKLNV